LDLITPTDVRRVCGACQADSHDVGCDAFGDPRRRLVHGVPRQMRIPRGGFDMGMASSFPITGRLSPSANAREAKLWRKS